MTRPGLFDTPPAVQLPPPRITVRRKPLTGRDLAEEGKQRALDNAGDWVALIVEEARAWCAARRGMRVTLEQFRQDAKAAPSSHKAWGALPRILCKAKILTPVTHSDGSAIYTPAGSLKTHAHPVRVWQVL